MTSTQASPAELKRIRSARIYDKEDEDYKPGLPSSPTRGRKVTTPTKAQKLGLSPRKQGKSSSTMYVDTWSARPLCFRPLRSLCGHHSILRTPVIELLMGYIGPTSTQASLMAISS